MALIQLQAANLAYGHIPLLDNAELVVHPGERICLVGRNGAGKSTLLSVLEGRTALDSGRIWRQDGLRIARLAQEVPEGVPATLYEVVAGGLGETSALLLRLHEIEARLADASDVDRRTYGELQARAEASGAWTIAARVNETLQRLRLPPDQLMSQSSGGIRRRALLGQALVAEPDILLLDEPTNHLDIESIAELEAAVEGWQGTVIFITHDRAFVDRLATRIVELDRGVLRSYPGRYAEFTDRKARELQQEEDANRKFDQTLAQEEVWIRQGIKARRTRNEGRVRRLEALRRERAERLDRMGRVKLGSTEAAELSGKVVFEADELVCGYGTTPLLAPVSLLVSRGDRIGVIGRNGTGKSTLLRTLIGELPPVSGRIVRGTRVEVAYFDQERQTLDPERSVRDQVADGADHVGTGDRRRHVAGYLADFLFPSSRIHSPVKSLSGGERNRLLLARLFARPANVLVLDEPTNDLDLDTLELLEERVADFDGTLFIVSHDRQFLDKTVTSLVVVADGKVEEFPGGYSDWSRHAQERQRQRPVSSAEAGVSAAKVDSPVGASSSSAAARKGSHKLSYKEKRELEALPGLIEELENRQAELVAETTGAGFYRQPRDVVAARMKVLEEVQAHLSTAYARWEALEG